MKVVSLFDGISAAQVALKNLGVRNTYHASEIDPQAIAVTQYHFPSTMQLGDASKLKFTIPNIDLLVGGSPCQNLSVAGGCAGFVVGNKSILFAEYVRALQNLKPKYFLFENVGSMKDTDKKIISEVLDCQPVQIDSGLVSAQRRPRYYWCNFPVKPLTDKYLVIKDIAESNASHKFNVSPELNAVYNDIPDGGNWRSLPDGHPIKLSMIAQRARSELTGKVMGGQSSFWRKYGENEKCPCLTASGIKQKMTRVVWRDTGHGYHRYPTYLECERLQTFPDGYTSVAADKYRYSLLGNSFTVDVIKNILSNIV